MNFYKNILIQLIKLCLKNVADFFIKNLIKIEYLKFIKKIYYLKFIKKNRLLYLYVNNNIN